MPYHLLISFLKLNNLEDLEQLFKERRVVIRRALDHVEDAAQKIEAGFKGNINAFKEAEYRKSISRCSSKMASPKRSELADKAPTLRAGSVDRYSLAKRSSKLLQQESEVVIQKMDSVHDMYKSLDKN